MGSFGGAFGTLTFGEASGDTCNDPTLIFEYTDLTAEVAEYLGFDRVPTDQDEIDKVDRIVQEGLRTFYTPPPVAEGAEPHVWSFMRPVNHISLIAGFSAYELPCDFGGGTEQFIPVSGATRAPIRIIDLNHMLSLQSQGDALGTPLYASIRAKKGDLLTSQAYEVMFFPKPDVNFTVQYIYHSSPDKLSAANPIHLGGSLHSQTVLNSCLAIAEIRHNKNSRPEIHALFMASLQRSITLDSLLATETDESVYEVFSSVSTSLGTDFNYLATEVGGALGFGHDPGVYSHAQTESVRRILDRGLRQFYYPPLLSRQFTTWPWSFLKPTRVLDTVADDADYDLGADVGSIIGTLTYGTQTTFPPLREVSENSIRELQQGFHVQTGRPELYAVRARGATGDALQVFEILLWPTPNSVFNLSYQFNVIPSRITAENPFPLSGSQDSETLLSSCLAVIEDDMTGPKYAKFMALLEGSVKRDQARSTPDLIGRMRDDSDHVVEFDPRRSNTLSLNGSVIITP